MTPTTLEIPQLRPAPKPLPKRAMMLTRRLHLYTGLFLFPWAVLYGVTAFLFNHPTAFADAPTINFGRAELVGTPLENPIDLDATADAVVAELNRRAPAGTRYIRTGPANYRLDAAFATVTPADGSPAVSMLFDANGTGGTARQQPPPKPPAAEVPFATSPRSSEPRRNREPKPSGSGVALPDSLADRICAAAPEVVTRLGFPSGEAVVTSVPDLGIPVTDGTTHWRADYNALTGAVTGREIIDAEPISVRRFLLRLHTAHGYSSSSDARWWWAVVVDLMAATMVFWGISGLAMWWQLKAARRLGLLVILASLTAATALAATMHAAMTS